VYTSWGSHCDSAPYAGWVLSYNETTLAQTAVVNLEPNGSDGAIWAAGAGPAADANGNIYLLTGNGTFDTRLNSSNFPAEGDFGNSFVKIATSSGGMAINDYFTMTNTVSESAGDVDLGSAGLVLLPQVNNSQGEPVSLLVGAGKDGNIYVVNQSGMGGFNPSMDSIYQFMPHALPSGTWASPAWFNGVLYYGGVNDRLRAFQFASGSFSPMSESGGVFGYPGTTPSVSANGTADGIVWAVENGSPAVLHAYDATNLATELYSSTQAAGNRDQFGDGNKFIVPTVANGKVYVGTTNGVGVFGLLTNSASPSLSISKAHKGSFVQGQRAAIFSVAVSNATGAGPTSGAVTVTDEIPTGLTLLSMYGSGWSCTGATCARSDALSGGESYPLIAVVVSVAIDAPATTINVVGVSGGGDPSGPKSASDMVNIVQRQHPSVRRAQ
jgi:hypothetical protein